MVFSETQNNVVNLVEGEEFIVRQVISEKHDDNILDKSPHHFPFQLRRQVSVQLLQVQELSRGEMQFPQQQQQQQQLPTRDHIRGVL